MPRSAAHPRRLLARLRAAIWRLRGRRALARGDVAAAVLALRRALALRPGAFGALIDLAAAHLRVRDLPEAHRALVLAREADPRRFLRVAPRLLGREGLEAAALAPELVRPATAPAPVSAGARRRAAARHQPASHPFGDCRDLDEYTRFQAMPPITEAERDAVDWDALLEDLGEEG